VIEEIGTVYAISFLGGRKDMEKNEKAHSGFRKGLSDYNDGENVTHYGGNSDYHGSNLKDENIVRNNPKLDGKVAEGNDLSEEELSHPET
jgi:ABC-type sugar transport system substrate-binding protein